MATKSEAVRTARLTKRTVDAAQPTDSRFTVWDDELKGFGLRVEPRPIGSKVAQTKTYVVRYRVGGGRRGTLRQFKIGRHGPLTPDLARAEAERILALVQLGKDPQAERVAGRETLTVAELCDVYLAEGVSTKKASTLALDRIRIARHIKPLLGSRRITDVTSADIDRLMKDVANGKVKAEATPHTRGGPSAASRTVGLLMGIFKFAVSRRLCSENPAKGVRRFKDKTRERYLSPKELGDLGDVLTAAEAEGAHPYHVAIIRLLALTGARKNEVAGLRWSEVKDEGSWLQLDDSKTGQKTIRLGAAAQELLSKVVRTKSAYVFPDPRDATKPIRNLDWFWVGARKRAVLEDVRIHDLRHSFASVGVAGGSSLFLMGKLLGHAHVVTTSRYTHLADDPVRAAADRISETISGAMNGEDADIRRLKSGASHD